MTEGEWSSLAFRHWALGNLSEYKVRELFITYPDDKPLIIQANVQNQVKVVNQYDSCVIPKVICWILDLSVEQFFYIPTGTSPLVF